MTIEQVKKANQIVFDIENWEDNKRFILNNSLKGVILDLSGDTKLTASANSSNKDVKRFIVEVQALYNKMCTNVLTELHNELEKI